MASEIWQLIVSSGVIGLIGSLVVSRFVNFRLDKMAEDKSAEKEERFLMMKLVKKNVDLTELMADKLHAAGVINGDLEKLKQETEAIEEDYHRLLMRFFSERQ